MVAKPHKHSYRKFPNLFVFAKFHIKSDESWTFITLGVSHSGGSVDSYGHERQDLPVRSTRHASNRRPAIPGKVGVRALLLSCELAQKYHSNRLTKPSTPRYAATTAMPLVKTLAYDAQERREAAAAAAWASGHGRPRQALGVAGGVRVPPPLGLR